MASFGELDAAIWEYQASQEISEEEASMRTEVIGRLQMLLSSSRVCPGAILKPYGSQVTGLQTKSSDIDLGFILPPHLQQHFSQQHVQHQRDMVQRVLANMTAELGRSNLISSLLCSTALCSALLHSTVMCSTLLYFTLIYSTALYSTLIYSTQLSYTVFASKLTRKTLTKTDHE
jgi:hypothetical protein